MKWLISLLLLTAFPILAQLPPSAVPGPAPYITNMTFTTNEGVVSSFSFTNPPPFTNTRSVLHSPKHLEMLSSLGRPMKRVTAAISPKQMLTGTAQVTPATPVAITIQLAWDYPTNEIPLVAFQLYAASTLTNSPPLTSWDQVPNNFFLVAEITSQTTYTFTSTEPQMFFIMRARNLTTNQFSVWNVLP